MASRTDWVRRDFLSDLPRRGAAVLAACSLVSAAGTSGQQKKSEEKEVSPVEDLMREHGVLKRVLLIYRDAVRKIEAGTPPPADTITGGADIMRRFIEAYHEKLEEEHLFPRFRKAGRLVELVNVLEDQHRKGRILSGKILKLAPTAHPAGSAGAKELVAALQQFVRMYEPHEAREDTVLFPAFRDLVPDAEYDRLGDEFESREHQLFGSDGFEKMVDEVAAIEKRLGIYDLAVFTPRV